MRRARSCSQARPGDLTIRTTCTCGCWCRRARRLAWSGPGSTRSGTPLQHACSPLAATPCRCSMAWPSLCGVHAPGVRASARRRSRRPARKCEQSANMPHATGRHWRGARRGGNRRLAGNSPGPRHAPTPRRRVRIPVAVLDRASNGGRIGRICWLRHSLRHSRASEIRAQAVSGLALGAGDDVAVAVQRDSDIAVSGPGRDLFEIEAGCDEERDRTVPRLVQRDRLDAGRLPRLQHGRAQR